MKKRILSIVLALCLCFSSPSAVFAQQEEASHQEKALTAEALSAPAARDTVIPSPAEVYKDMIALKEQEQYKEGTPWTNDEPYSDAKGYYRWKGGTLDGVNIVAVGCVAFAFILSDAAFDSLPARMYATGRFEYKDIKPGDILRMNNDAHTVIVLEVSDAGVVVAEGNISTGDHKGKVHWGRAISKEDVMSSTSHYITRYPKGYVSPDDPTANDVIKNGALNSTHTWKLTKAGTLTISGAGAMPDFESAEGQPWKEFNAQIRKVVIENGVTRIGNCAFWNCGVLSAEIPSSVTMIGNSAFRGSSLVSVTVPSSVKTIGDSAFQSCTNLSQVNISEGVEIITQNAFQSCTNLKSITLPASIREVGAATFFQCTEMTSAKFVSGSKTVKMGDNMFSSCYKLMSVTLPKSIDGIGIGIFQKCLSLTRIDIPDGVQSIGESAFASCSMLTSVGIPASVATIERSAFTACASLKEIYFAGTEAQWNSIRMIADTASVMTNITKHYESALPAIPDTDDDDNEKPGGGDNPGEGNTPDSGDTPGNNAASITCKKTVYEVTYGTKPFKISASSTDKMTFTSSNPKIAAVDKITGKVTVKNTGIAIITINAGNAIQKVTVKVKPKKPSAKSTKTVKGKKLTVKWSKDKTASGYQVQISTDKKFKKNVKAKKLAKTSYTFKKLKKGKKYYVRLRSYKKSGKETLYGTWSKVKTSNKIKKQMQRRPSGDNAGRLFYVRREKIKTAYAVFTLSNILSKTHA